MTAPWVDGDWHRAVLPLDSTVEEAIRCLDESHLQIVLVVDRGTHLIGTLTDGDIRRGLLHGIGLGDAIDVLVQREPIVVSVGTKREEVRQIMKRRRIHEIPIVDDDNLVVGLASWSSAVQSADRILWSSWLEGKGPAFVPSLKIVPSRCCRLAVDPCWSTSLSVRLPRDSSSSYLRSGTSDT